MSTFTKIKTTTKSAPKLTKAYTPPEGHVAGSRECPVFMTLSLIANKWSMSLLHELMQAPKNTARFSVLKKALGAITQRELTKHLRQFEASGIVDRTVYPESPPRVEYTLTTLGMSLCDPIEALSRWAQKNGVHVQQKRAAFEKKHELVG